MKSARLKPRSRQAIKDKELDALCRELVFLRDRSRCQMSGEGQNLQWCHIYSRRYKSTRWDPDNSLVLTAGNHLKWHHRPLEMVAWFEQKFPERAQRLRLKMAAPQKVDRTLIKLWLKQEILKYDFGQYAAGEEGSAP